MPVLPKRLTIGCCLAAAALTSSKGHATPALGANNGSGLDTHLFRPAMDSKGFFTVNGADVLGHNDISFGLHIDYGRILLRVPNVGQKSPQLINHSFQGTLHFNYGFLNRFMVGLAVPIDLMLGDAQIKPDGTGAVPGWSTNSLQVGTVGFVAMHLKAQITPADSALGFAVGAQLGLPVNSASKSGGADPNFWYWPSAILERRFGPNGMVKLALNAGYRGHLHASGTVLQLENGTFQDGNLLTYGGALSVRVIRPLDIVAETYGTYLFSDSAIPVKTSNEVVGGIKVFIEKNSFLLIGAGPRYLNGFEAADLRAFIGFVFEPSINDRDQDGIPDGEDACPNVKGLRTDDPKTNGCPPQDRDHDGIPDDEDACPDTPGSRTDNDATNGCPPDRDHDGIPDEFDACPDVPGIATRNPLTNGCPPNAPTLQLPIPIPDRDNDGIPDVEDACPDLPGKAHNDPKTNGCPDIFLSDNQVVVLQKIQFATGSAEILPASFELLDTITTLLREHSELTLLEIAGHADERGSAVLNSRLTQARVNSVRVALIKRGITANRLRSKGYGFYCPEDPGHNDEAWEKNRRVEFKIVKTTAGKTGAELGCAAATKAGISPDPVP